MGGQASFESYRNIFVLISAGETQVKKIRGKNVFPKAVTKRLAESDRDFAAEGHRHAAGPAGEMGSQSRVRPAV